MVSPTLGLSTRRSARPESPCRGERRGRALAVAARRFALHGAPGSIPCRRDRRSPLSRARDGSTGGIHRAGRGAGDPRLAGESDGRGGGRARRRDVGPGGGAVGGLDRGTRGGRAARRGQVPLRRQGRGKSGGGGVGRDRSGADRDGGHRSAGDRPAAGGSRRHPRQGPAGGERPARGVAGGGEGGRGVLGAGVVPVCGRPERARVAGADDEHHQRRRARRQLGGCAGVHGRPGRRRVVQGGVAVGRGGLPLPQERAQE